MSKVCCLTLLLVTNSVRNFCENSESLLSEFSSWST
jgi:hypothetical protein